ncbi:ankyrin repeat-containing domain protein [Coprinopsis sp. MPI-PUGE-AT-0042]|nr:ankyrin repeat-containing domain protein [Coprinopsis sp. MPI-PUGE-AT-0042]
MIAPYGDHEPVVQLLLDRQATDINLQDEKGDTALHRALSAGDTSIAIALLQRTDIYVNVNARNKSGKTVLMLASCRGYEPVVRLLVGRQATDVNLQDNLRRESALHLASSGGHAPTVGALLQRTEIDTNARNAWGATPLIFASFNGHEHVVRQLLDHETNQTDANLQDEEGDTALHHALSAGHTSIAITLLQCSDIDANARNKSARTALMLASHRGYEPVVQLLLGNQATDLNLQDENGGSALMNAAMGGHTSIVELLLNHPDVKADLCNNEGQTALQLALSKGYVQIVQHLSSSRG